MFSNRLLRVSARAGQICQFPYTPKTNFTHYMSIQSARNLPDYDSSPTATAERRRMIKSDESRNDNLLMNNTSKIRIKDASNFSDDADVFGTLSRGSSALDELEMDEGDRREEEFLEHKVDASQKLSTKEYADMIKEHLNNNNLKAAIDILQERMIKQDQVKPENYIYNLLIGACGRAGQAKQAFHLYNQMKKRSLVVTGGTYTALFNACATTHYPKDGLQRANNLREIMNKKLYQPNATNYHAMIKAYGRCGDLKTAFSLVDEMIANEHVPTQETYNFLLHACVSDRDAGFRHALLVWRKLREHGVRPNTYTYNLMLRAVRDCGLGKQEVASDVIRRIVGAKQLLLAEAVSDSATTHRSENSKPTTSHTSAIHSNEDRDRISNAGEGSGEIQPRSESTDMTENWPNLLAVTPHLGNAVSIAECVTPQDRLLLLGGCSALLGHMTQDGAWPNIKTFTQLVDVIPSTVAAEKALIRSMKQHGVPHDVGFYNMLIKKRSMRSDYSSARQVLDLVSKARLTPDVVTFGVLALGCKTEQQATQLLQQMSHAGYRVNIEILGAMLKHACLGWKFGYVLEMMETARRHNLTPNAQFYQHLHTFYTNGRRLIHDKDNGAQGIDFVDADYFRSGYRLFCARYKTWLREMEPSPQPIREERSNNDREEDNRDDNK